MTPSPWTIVVENIGAGTATGVTLSDPLPSGVELESGGGLHHHGCGRQRPRTAPWARSALDDETFTVTGTAGADDCGTINNTATVAATNEPGNAWQQHEPR